MAHTNDEQLLNELLREIAQEDRRAGPDAELARRVMAGWDDGSSIVHRPSSIVDRPSSIVHRRSLARRSALREGGAIAYWAICGIAAAVFIAIAIPRTPLADLKVGTTAVTTTMPAASFPPSRSYGEVSPEPREIGRAAAERPTPVPTTRRQAARRTAPPPAPAHSEAETVEFVPLVPMSPEEFSGSFQIVRVQMPRASLAALATTPDISGTNELVETDVLLGEDGMARAIRVSTSGTVYPWRSR